MENLPSTQVLELQGGGLVDPTALGAGLVSVQLCLVNLVSAKPSRIKISKTLVDTLSIRSHHATAPDHCKSSLHTMCNTSPLRVPLSEEGRPALPIAQVRAGSDTLV